MELIILFDTSELNTGINRIHNQQSMADVKLIKVNRNKTDFNTQDTESKV